MGSSEAIGTFDAFILREHTVRVGRLRIFKKRPSSRRRARHTVRMAPSGQCGDTRPLRTLRTKLRLSILGLVIAAVGLG